MKANHKFYCRLEIFETETPGTYYVRGVPGLHLVGTLENLLGTLTPKSIERLRRDNGDERKESSVSAFQGAGEAHEP